MSRVMLAAQLIQDQDFDIAAQMLKKEKEQVQAFKWLSLIHRLRNRYEEEETLVKEASERFPEEGYFQERLAWHQTPMFDRLVPREPVHMPKSRTTRPHPETLENMCIVTGGNKELFPHIVECIESIKATRDYGTLPIGVIDFGLTDEQKHFLAKTFHVTIGKPDASTRIWELARVLSYKVFPGYQYYFWFSPETWVHDECAMDQYAVIAQQQKIAYPISPRNGKDMVGQAEWFQKGLLPEPRLQNKRLGSSSVFCAHKDFLEAWHKLIPSIMLISGTYAGVADASLMYATLKHLPNMHSLMGHQNNFFFERDGFPVVYDNSNLLYNPQNNQLVGIVNLIGGEMLTKYYLPTQKRTTPLKPEELQGHQQLSIQALNGLQDGNKITFPNGTLFAAHYRVWPYAVEVKEEIMREAKVCLG